MINIIPQSFVPNRQIKDVSIIVQWNLLPLLRFNKPKCRAPTPTYSKATTYTKGQHNSHSTVNLNMNTS